MTNTKAKRETNALTKDFGKGSESWSFSPPDIPSYGSQGHFIRGDFLWVEGESKNDATGRKYSLDQSPALLLKLWLTVQLNRPNFTDIFY